MFVLRIMTCLSRLRDFHTLSLQKGQGNSGSTSSNIVENIVFSHDFAEGMHSWHPNSCKASLVSPQFGEIEGMGDTYARVTNRKECWQGLEQDITNRVVLGTTYSVTACVGVSGDHKPLNVQATLKLESKSSDTNYLCIGRWVAYLICILNLFCLITRNTLIFFWRLAQDFGFREKMGDFNRHFYTFRNS